MSWAARHQRLIAALELAAWASLLFGAFLLGQGCASARHAGAAAARWEAFSVSGVVLARTFLPAHQEPVQRRDGGVGVESVPALCAFVVVTRFGPLVYRAPAAAVVFRELQPVRVQGVVSPDGKQIRVTGMSSRFGGPPGVRPKWQEVQHG